MNNLESLSLLLLAVITIASVILTYLKSKKNKKEFDPEEFLESFVNDILNIATSAQEILELDKDKFSSIDEYIDALSLIVLKEFKLFLSKKFNVNKTILALLSDEMVTTFIRRVVKAYSKELGLNSIIPFMKIEEPIVDEVIVTDPTLNKVNILDDINKIIDKE